MPRRVVGIFSAEDSAELAQSLVLVLVELLRMGHRVRVVDADPAHGHLSRIADSTGDWQATDFLALLCNNNLGARGWDITQAVATQQPERAYLDIVPVLPRGSALRPDLLESPPLLGARRYLFLRERLTDAEPAVDLVLLLAPVGDNRLARSLLAQGVDAAVFYACGEPKQVALLGQLRQTADALRGALIPCLCWEGRDGRESDLGQYWQTYFTTDRRLSQAQDRHQDAPPAVMVLGDEEGQEVELALAIRRLVQVHEHDPLERLREADAEDWPEVAEGAFAELRVQDPIRARALFDAEIAPRLGTRLSAVAATRAVWQAADADLEEKRHFASITIQKFRLEDPSPQATFLVDCFTQLCDAANADPSTRDPARLYINLAEALLHEARWRQVQGEGHGDRPERAEALLLRASKLPRRPTDRARSALVWGRHARLTGSARRYDEAIQDLNGLGNQIPTVEVFRYLIDTIILFAPSQPSLWPRVLTLALEIMPSDLKYGHWALAVAQAHMGQRRKALDQLLELGMLDRDAFHAAVSDPDLAPLWEGAGRLDYAYSPAHPPPKKR